MPSDILGPAHPEKKAVTTVTTKKSRVKRKGNHWQNVKEFINCDEPDAPTSNPAPSHSISWEANSRMIKALEAFSLFAKRWWPAVLWMMLIILASLDWASGGHTVNILKPILRWLDPDITMQEIYDFNLLFRKSCHFFQFLILALLIWRTRGSWRFVSPKADFRFSLFVLLLSVIFAAASEVIQRYITSRTSSFRDVMIDLSGSVMGILIALIVEAIYTRRTARESMAAPKASPKVLLTADLNLENAETKSRTLAELRQAVAEHRPDILVVAGNIGDPIYAARWLRELKTAAVTTPVAFCLGRRDHWLPPDLWTEYPTPASVREKLWAPAVRETGVLCLDFQNAHIPGLVITGGYGHFDLKFYDEDLRLNNQPVTRDDYLTGRCSGLEWKDMSRIPFAADNLLEEAKIQAAGIGHRLSEAASTGEPILLVTGTAPFWEWSGHGDTPGSIMNFFRAYAGNSLLQPDIVTHATSIRAAVCGYSHAPVSPITVSGIPGTNLGQGRNEIRFMIFETETGEVRSVSRF